VLDLVYGKERPGKAAPYAVRLLRLLDKHDPGAETLLGTSGRWLLADMDEDYEEAIFFREKELKTLRKHIRMGILKTGAMCPDEFSDRLDMLAGDYLKVGRYADALAALAESEAFCKKHGIPFDGKNVRADVKRTMKKRK